MHRASHHAAPPVPPPQVWRTMWRDFGGGREAADADSAATAAREFAEETLGLFGTCAVNQAGVLAAAAAMEAQLRDSSQAIKVGGRVVVGGGGWGGVAGG